MCLPYFMLLGLASLSVQKCIIFVFYLSYKFIKYQLTKNTIKQLNVPHIQQFLNDFLVDSKRYIDIKVVNKPKLSQHKKYIFLYSPHAIYNQGFIYLFGLDDNILNKRQNKRIIPLVDPMFNGVPIISDFFAHFGFMECSREKIEDLLDNDYSVALSCGGIQELLTTETDVESIYIKKRNSIFKIAQEKNVEIIPVFSSGESDWYEPLFKCNKMPSKYMSIFTYTFVWGKLFQPWMPKKNKLSIIFGKPIKITNDWNEMKNNYVNEVEHLHVVLNKINNENRSLKIY